MQGAEAPAELCGALRLLDAVGECDVIIIGRGGGSAEDLWAFNNEELVRAIAAAHTPIISAVGHETDTTLCDFAADKRAPTPSAAAELAVPDRVSLMQSTDERADRLDRAMDRIIADLGARLDAREKQLALASPTAKLESMGNRLSRARELMDAAVDKLMDKRRMILGAAVGRLEATNPLGVIKRGYSVTETREGRIVSSVDGVNEGDGISVLVSDGYIDAVVSGKRPKANTRKER